MHKNLLNCASFFSKKLSGTVPPQKMEKRNEGKNEGNVIRRGKDGIRLESLGGEEGREGRGERNVREREVRIGVNGNAPTTKLWICRNPVSLDSHLLQQSDTPDLNILLHFQL
jgi:hypothetical protein